MIFSPELAPPNTPATPGVASPSPPPFNLNTISQGISTADFYLGIPTAVFRFLEQDAHTRLLAKPQLRGAEGRPMTLNLGQEIPVVSTVFGAPVQGGFASIPQSSFNYRPVGINMEILPRVTYDGEVILELTVENSALGPSIDVAGQSVPSFTSRKVQTKLRLREGESNLLAGLIREEERRSLQGIAGLINVPVLNSILGSNTRNSETSDIVMLLTPHIVRTHELTVNDLAPIYIGTQQNIGLAGPPPLIAPPPDDPARGSRPGCDASSRARRTSWRRASSSGRGRSGCADRHAARATWNITRACANWPGDGTAIVPAASGRYAASARHRSNRTAARSECAGTRDTRCGGCRRDRADHRDAAGDRVPRRGWSVHSSRFGEQRLEVVDADDHDHLQPAGAACAQRAGRNVHAAGQRHRDIRAAHRRRRRPRRHRRRQNR